MLQIANRKKFFVEIGKALLKLSIAGVLIGLLKQYDLLLAILLSMKILHVIYMNIFKAKSKNWILLLGMLLTGIGGIMAEQWGVSNQYWEYHKVARELPLWLPFAWALAFYFLYKVEVGLIENIKQKTLQSLHIFVAKLNISLNQIPGSLNC